MKTSSNFHLSFGVLALMGCWLHGDVDGQPEIPPPSQEYCFGEPPLSSDGEPLPQTCILVPQDNRTRCFYTFVPDCAEGKTPIVMTMHGIRSCGRLHSELSGWIDKAAEECITVVFPEVTDVPSSILC